MALLSTTMVIQEKENYLEAKKTKRGENKDNDKIVVAYDLNKIVAEEFKQYFEFK